MSRPSVSVVMPFAGGIEAAELAARWLGALRIEPADELILVDNAGVAPEVEGITIIRALDEPSPAHARNAGARRAGGDWILFLDSDCRAPASLLEDYFTEPVPPDVGALAGEVAPAADASTLAGRYGAARSFLSQQAHLAHPYMPRAAAANLMVRASAFRQLGGFQEGLRAAEDTDFSWRLQRAGWRLELRSQARVEHTYRASVAELRRQWRSYAAGRAWLARRYPGFRPQPALRRIPGRLLGRPARAHSPRAVRPGGSASEPGVVGVAGRLERGRYLALDVLLAAEELRGLGQSNRPAGPPGGTPVGVVLVAERFPARGDPLLGLALTLQDARVEAAARPEEMAAGAVGALTVAYREDDGVAQRLRALGLLLARHPLRCLHDVTAGSGRARASLLAIAPAAIRLGRDQRAVVHPLGGVHARDTAARLAALTGRPLSGKRG